MMIISDVVKLAKYSELSGLSIKDNIEAIVAFINLGMLEIYTRFPVKVEEHLITLDANETYYKMPSDFMYATYAYAEAPIDSLEQTVELHINDTDNDEGIYFTSWDTLQVPNPATGAVISVIYVTKPTAITEAQANDGLTELALPDMLIDALLSYVGYRGYMGVRADGKSENSSQWLRFERNCKKALENGVASPGESLSMDTRLSTRGFA